MNIAVNKTPAELAYGGMLLPHPRMEDWSWTNLRVLIDRPYPPRVTVSAAAEGCRAPAQASTLGQARARPYRLRQWRLSSQAVRACRPGGDVKVTRQLQPPALPMSRCSR